MMLCSPLVHSLSRLAASPASTASARAPPPPATARPTLTISPRGFAQTVPFGQPSLVNQGRSAHGDIPTLRGTPLVARSRNARPGMPGLSTLLCALHPRWLLVGVAEPTVTAPSLRSSGRWPDIPRGATRSGAGSSHLWTTPLQPHTPPPRHRLDTAHSARPIHSPHLRLPAVPYVCPHSVEKACSKSHKQ